MILYKHLLSTLVAIIVFGGSVFANDLLAPDSVLVYNEKIVIVENGDAEVTVTVHVAATEPGTYIVPLNSQKAQNVTQVTRSPVQISVVEDRGVKFLGVTFPEDPAGINEPIVLTYNLPGFYVYEKQRKDNLGRIRFSYTFDNTVPANIKEYMLTVLFIDPYNVHFVGELTNIVRGRSSSFDAINVITDHDLGKRGFRVIKEDLAYRKSSSIRVELVARSVSVLFLLALLAFGAWAVFYYRDHLEDTGEERQLVKGLE
ncbi:MAG: hypothetical protein EA363_12155 [Balneolaceae bacterium]|nr:MAG: hypothetical protein EA363_12155 [Balneolaceae bacterium]